MSTPETDETRPEITRVLHALTDRLHESLCNCRDYPDGCVSKDGYRRDDLVWTFSYAEAALTEALKQGWTLPAPVAPSSTEDTPLMPKYVGRPSLPPTQGPATRADAAVEAAIARGYGGRVTDEEMAGSTPPVREPRVWHKDDAEPEDVDLVHDAGDVDQSYLVYARRGPNGLWCWLWSQDERVDEYGIEWERLFNSARGPLTEVLPDSTPGGGS